MSRTPQSGVLGGVLAVSLILGGAATVHAVGKFSKKEDAVVATQTALTKPVQKSEKKKPDQNTEDGTPLPGEP